jgi:molybdopterin synthase catalytic subunit
MLRHIITSSYDGRELMDYLKTEAPFWKKQHLIGGTGDWVAAKEEDEAATQKWRV